MRQLLGPDAQERFNALKSTMDAADWFAHGILRVLAANSANRFGWSPVLYGDKIGILDRMISALEHDPELQSSVPPSLRSLSHLYFLKAASFGQVGNAKDEDQALTAAVEADPMDRSLRFCRAMRWLSNARIAPADKLAELRLVVDGAAQDNRDMETAHAALAMLLVANPSLGTAQEARGHWEQARRAGARIRRAHAADPPPTSELLRTARAHFEGGAGAGAGQLGPVLGMIQDGRSSECARCGRARNETGEALHRCGSCRRVWYCGRDCQKADWPSHKALCRTITGDAQQL